MIEYRARMGSAHPFLHEKRGPPWICKQRRNRRGGKPCLIPDCKRDNSNSKLPWRTFSRLSNSPAISLAKDMSKAELGVAPRWSQTISLDLLIHFSRGQSGILAHSVQTTEVFPQPETWRVELSAYRAAGPASVQALPFYRKKDKELSASLGHYFSCSAALHPSRASFLLGMALRVRQIWDLEMGFTSCLTN